MKIFKLPVFFIAVLFAFTSCGGKDGGLFSGGGSDYDVETTTTSRHESWTYDPNSPIFEISPDVSSIDIHGIPEGKHIYLTKTNPSESTLPASYTQAVSTASGITLSAEETYESSSGSLVEILIGLVGILLGGFGYTAAMNFVPSVNYSASVDLLPAARSAVTQQINRTDSQLTLIENSTTKNIYVDKDSNITTFEKRNATLRACGTYCNVWVVDGYYTTSSASGAKVNTTICHQLADKFDNVIYNTARNTFGEESDQIYYYYTNGDFTATSMSKLSNTGMYDQKHNKVNIVIYDIANDYNSSNATGIVGYFYAKDYFPDSEDVMTLSGHSYTEEEEPLKSSNEGKYFYIDSYYAVKQTSMVYSTLAHEFQHMIHWNQKTMLHDTETGTGFNEMLSMLCEDIIQAELGLADDDSPKARLPMWERCYPDCGLEYRQSSAYQTLLSYASNYAFGAWLARNFGGRSLIKEMSTSAFADAEAIERATGKDMSYLLKWYSYSCVDSDSYNVWPYYSFNNSKDTMYNIDLWRLSSTLPSTYKEGKSSGYYKFDSPNAFGHNAQYNLRPYGMTLLYIGKKNSPGTTTINFSNNRVAVDEHVYIVVTENEPSSR